MNKQQKETEWGATEHALIGGLVGGAGVGNSIALIGLSTGLAVLPISIVMGVVGGLVWWGVRTIAKKL
jgi:predicted lipid-binding transport protein (Tim44 family)